MDIMIRGVKAFGRGDLDTRIHLPNNNEFRLLATSFNEMASSLSSAQKELVAKKIMDRELEIAHDIQRTLIPANIKQPDGYEIASYYKAAMQVGGDYVDAIPIDSTRIAFVMADVSGKGIPGLVVMAMLKIMAHDLIKKGISPKNVIRRLNGSLAANIRRNMFVTMFLAVLDTESGDLTFSNAGHNPVVIYDNTKKRCELRRVKGRPLGLFDDDVFIERLEEVHHTLKVGDLMLLYTDGLTESQDDKSEQFGVKRVVWLCESFADAGASTLVEELVRAEHAFRGDGPQTDDLTLLAVRSVGPHFGREKRSIEEVAELCLSS
jgi:sigma-B regulation protein RsbU (phosphoserine phosphatase)